MTLLDAELTHLSQHVGEFLRARAWRLATAESCTGGWIGAALTAIPGSSAWYEGGVVSYANAAKIKLLGVPESLLEQRGAVSEAVAMAMAEGARSRLGVDLALAVTGIAGPDGGTETKPVGMVCIAWVGDSGRRVRTFHFDGDRDAIRRQSVVAALQGILAAEPSASGASLLC